MNPAGDQEPTELERPYTEALFMAFRNGDGRAFGELMRLHSDRLESFVCRTFPHRADVEDVLQETWLRAWLHRRSFRGDGPSGPKRSFTAWIGRVCRSITTDAAITDRRETQRLCELDAIDYELFAADSSGQETTNLEELAAIAIDLVAKLPDRQQAVFRCRCIAGMNTAQTAAALRCSPGTVKATLNAARLALRKGLASKDFFVR